jgi:heterotetrameric sarcosine oxidase gamma subunit
VIEVLGPDAIFQVDGWIVVEGFPPACRSVDEAGRRILWSGPKVWLVRAPDEDRVPALGRLEEVLAGGGVVTDASASFTRIRISGPEWRKTLMIGGVFDAESPAFAPGCVAATVIEHIPVRLDVVDDDTVDVYVAPSYAPHLLALWASA